MGATLTSKEVKFSASWATAVTVSNVLGMYEPPHRSVWATGQEGRRSSQMGYGSVTKPGSKMS